MKKCKQWIKVSLLTLAILIVLIITLNYKIDSLGLYGNSSFLKKAALALTEGNIIAGLKNFDNRLFQLHIINNLKTKTDVITIGSSRSMQVRKTLVSNSTQTYFNHSVAGASLKDYISILGIYKKNLTYLPKKIILGVDPWIFNKYNGQSRYKTLSSFYNYMLSELSLENKIYLEKEINTNKYKQLINYEYTLANIKFLKNYLKNGMKAFYIIKSVENHKYVRGTDGTSYEDYTKYNLTEINRKAIAYTNGNVYSLGGFKELSHTKLFETLIKYLQENGSEVIFFLHPYHPLTYDKLSKNQKYKIIVDTENYLRNFAQNNKISIYGSYNPKKYNLIDNDFLDGMHSKDNVPKLIFKNLKN